MGSLDNISKIVIRGITDPAGIGFDDFSFNVPADVKITSGRVSGYLNGTTQNALLGADTALQATPLPGAFAGGTYAWTCTPTVSCSIITVANSSSVTLRTNEVGTFTATVTYTKNGLTATGSVTINSMLPTLTKFTAQQQSDRVNSPGTCRPPSPDSVLWWYDLGCRPSSVGITFSSSLQAPTTFISDPRQSGVKYVQAVNTFRKKMERGLRCDTIRTDESDIGSGWQLDTSDPFSTAFGAVNYFSLLGSPGMGDTLPLQAEDPPGRALTGFVDYHFLDTLYIDERFETYVVYFTGNNPANPPIQRPLGKLVWKWGGLVVFDWNGNDAVHKIRFSNAPPASLVGQIFAPAMQNASSMVTMHGNVTGNNPNLPCPGGPAVTNNPIDSSREFVKYHFIDFLGRNPAGDATHASDLVGWNFWTSGISQCVFDLNCVHSKRVNTGLAFFYSGEFINSDPDMANPPGTPGFNPGVYNRKFVYWLYQKYLGRDPTGDPGWDFWTNDLNSNGNYAHIVDAFQSSTEYRDQRQFQ